jgi:hypothetical protein
MNTRGNRLLNTHKSLISANVDNNLLFQSPREGTQNAQWKEILETLQNLSKLRPLTGHEGPDGE